MVALYGLAELTETVVSITKIAVHNGLTSTIASLAARDAATCTDFRALFFFGALSVDGY